MKEDKKKYSGKRIEGKGGEGEKEEEELQLQVSLTRVVRAEDRLASK